MSAWDPKLSSERQRHLILYWVNSAVQGHEFRKLPSGPPHTIVRSCFGQICAACLAGSSTYWKCDRCFRVTFGRRGRFPPHFEAPTAKACDGKGKVWSSQGFRFWQRSKCRNLLGRASNSRHDLHWLCRVCTITARD